MVTLRFFLMIIRNAAGTMQFWIYYNLVKVFNFKRLLMMLNSYDAFTIASCIKLLQNGQNGEKIARSLA